LGGGADLADKRGANPVAATSPNNLARKIFREQCWFTDALRRDYGQKKNKRNGFRHVNQNLAGRSTLPESLDLTAHPLTQLIKK
jgi:hypothetical protein